MTSRFHQPRSALGRSQDMTRIWFAVPTESSPPRRVFVRINDRACGATYTSDPVQIPSP